MGSKFHAFCTVIGARLVMALILICWAPSVSCSVSYDQKAIVIDGQRRILISGSIHYPRSTPEMWPDLIRKAKAGGLDVIQTYVFWSGHEPSQGQYYFEDRFNLVKFVKLVQQAGLYVHLRIGPYVCAEWNLGGFPVWLKYVPGIAFRTDNQPFKDAMQGFAQRIVDMMKAEKLFQPQGGPIILSQIENEFELVEWEIGEPGRAYTKWAADMAVGLGTGVSWVMCKQADAPDPVINTCNGFYCENFEPNSNNKPKMWTEVWTGWYTGFGEAVPHRPAQDLAFAVARFVQNRGSFFNYYMYHGGTNFGRTAGGPFIATSYDFDAPIDEFGLIREPKWSHLRELHQAIKQSESALLAADPVVSSLGSEQEAHVFESESGACAAFLANYDTQYSAKVTFRNEHYDLPRWSISILPDCKTAVYNTATIEAKTSPVQMVPVKSAFPWQSYREEIFSFGGDGATNEGLLEQISVTRDVSDYLWYAIDFTVSQDEAFLTNGQYPVFTVSSSGHALHVFVNGHKAGWVYGGLENPRLTYRDKVMLTAGINKVSLLSVAVGLPNIGLHFETWNAGVLGPITLEGMNSGKWDLSKWKWSCKVGLKGEALSLHAPSGSSSVEWTGALTLAQNQPLIWYKTFFNAPRGNTPLALDMNGMGKGQIWINGRSIGRHWPAYTAHGTCGACDYAGIFDESKCRSHCGEASQRRYHIPRSWLKPTGNLLVVFEEWGGDPTRVSLVQSSGSSPSEKKPGSSHGPCMAFFVFMLLIAGIKQLSSFRSCSRLPTLVSFVPVFRSLSMQRMP